MVLPHGNSQQSRLGKHWPYCISLHKRIHERTEVPVMDKLHCISDVGAFECALFA